MRNALKHFVKWAIAKTPFRLIRAPHNRFQAIDECLMHLKRLGYEPKVIVDGGAHLGDFAMLVHAVFPDADVHMIEPQPACRKTLLTASSELGFKLHPFALVSAEEDGNPVMMAAGSEPSTGSYIVPLTDVTPESIQVETSTLDRLFSSIVNSDDRILLKLDLQGYELSALRGAVHMLASVEVVLTEVSFFAQAYEPPIAELIAFLAEREFQLFDIAALSSRARDNRLRQGDLVFVKRYSKLAKDIRWS